MRKTIGYFAAAALLLVLAGCSFVFSSNVTVGVTAPDMDAASFDSDVYVFGFTDKSSRDSAYNAIVEKAKEAEAGDFDDFLYSYYPDGCLDKRVAIYASGADSIIPGLESSGGTAATLTIRWNSSSPAFGEDYDSTYVYLIAAVEEDGLFYAGENEWRINSGSTTNNPVVRMYQIDQGE